MPWLVEDAYAASAAVAGPRMTWESARVFRRRGGQVEGRATVTANGSWMRRSDELIREPSSAAWLNADCPKRSSVLALEGVEELHGTSQARPDGRARLCTRHNRLLLGGPQRSVDHAPKHETSKNFQKTCFSPWLNRRDPLKFASSVFLGSFHGNRSDGLGGSSFRCGHRIRRDTMLLQSIDGRRTEGGDRHGMPARRYQRGDKKSPRVLDTRSAYHHNRQFSTEGCPSG